jgi:carboxymethylenebutenolidase
MGGQYALLAACTCRGLAACVAFYGMVRYEPGLDPSLKPRQPLDALADLRCPVLGLYGAEDALIPSADVEELRARLARTGRPFDLHVYAGAGHAFMNEARAATYRPEAAADAWARMLAFFRAHLAEQLA